MALLERVATLLRANLNDLLEKAEDPEKLLRQVILDMENQLIQVKTQVAIAIADQHLLEKKQQEKAAKAAEWTRKAELAVAKGHDDLARAAIERSLSYRQMSESYTQQIEDQKTEAENLKSALRKLDQKLAEARSRGDLLIAQHRRARVIGKANQARSKAQTATEHGTFGNLENRVQRSDAINRAHAEVLSGDSLEDRFAHLEREEEIDRLLQEIKARKSLSA